MDSYSERRKSAKLITPLPMLLNGLCLRHGAPFEVSIERMKHLKSPKPLSKLNRQLLILHIFHYCRVTEYAEITNLISVSKRTIDRDIAELTEAGILDVEFSRKENGFIHKDERNKHGHDEITVDSKAKQAHLDKLARLADVMFSLDTDDIMSWYAEHYPSVSKRTIQRDLQILNDIGYRIRYDFYEKQYTFDFPTGMMSVF